MKHGVYAETPTDKLQNKLRGVGSLMLREDFTLSMRLYVARAFHQMLINDARFGEIQSNTVFAAFFVKGELSDAFTEMPEITLRQKEK